MSKSRILAISALTVSALVAGTLLLPRHIEVERTAVIAAAPAQIIALAASNQGYQQFNPYKNTDPDLKISLFGPSSGVGSGFAFDGKDGQGTQTITEVAADHVTFQIDLGAMGTPTQTFAVAPEGDASKVTWTMQADLGMNPIARVFGLFMDGMVGGTFETGFANLSKAVAS